MQLANGRRQILGEPTSTPVLGLPIPLMLVQKKLVEPKEAWMKAVDKTGLAASLKNAGPSTFT
jgi:hypothetical protein